MASKARTPENFPRMKVRGKGRRATRRYQEAVAALAALTASLPGVVNVLAVGFARIGAAAVEAARQIAEFYALAPAPRQRDYALWPPAPAALEGDRPALLVVDEEKGGRDD